MNLKEFIENPLTDEQIIWLLKNWFANRRGITTDEVGVEIIARKELNIYSVISVKNVSWSVEWGERFARMFYDEVIKNGVYKQ